MHAQGGAGACRGLLWPLPRPPTILRARGPYYSIGYVKPGACMQRAAPYPLHLSGKGKGLPVPYNSIWEVENYSRRGGGFPTILWAARDGPTI